MRIGFLMTALVLVLLCTTRSEAATGWRYDPCVVMASQARTAHLDSEETNWHLNLIGCAFDGGGVSGLQKYSPFSGEYLECNVTAYGYAKTQLAHKRSMLNLTPTKQFGTYMKSHGCSTLYEDWSWDK